MFTEYEIRVLYYIFGIVILCYLFVLCVASKTGYWTRYLTQIEPEEEIKKQ